MDFKFKEPGKKPEAEPKENEPVEESIAGSAFESMPAYTDVAEQQPPAREVEAPEPVSQPESAPEAPAKRAPVRPIPERFEIYNDSPIKTWCKRLFILAVLGGGGYMAYGYYTTGEVRIPSLPFGSEIIADRRQSDSTAADVQELTDLLNESRELLKGKETAGPKAPAPSQVTLSSRARKTKRSRAEILDTYRGRWVTIVTKDGLKREGTVVNVKDQVMHLQQYFSSGSIAVRVPIAEIQEIH